MKATSISTNIMGPCNAHCPFCISSVTWKTQRGDNRFLRQALPRALSYARYHGIDTVLITGSGEPALQRDLVFHVIAEARASGIPIIELQTNGALLALQPEYLDELASLNVTTIAISVASVDAARSAHTMEIGLDYFSLIERIADRGMLCRVSLNMIDHDQEALTKNLGDYADKLFGIGARQLTLRRLGVPERYEENAESRKRVEWIQKRALPEDAVRQVEEEIRTRGRRLRTLSYGASVHDYHGLSVCVADCATEASGEDEIRSLILMPDGHVYHSWSHAGSVLL